MRIGRRNVTKIYHIGDITVHAMSGISLHIAADEMKEGAIICSGKVF